MKSAKKCVFCLPNTCWHIVGLPTSLRKKVLPFLRMSFATFWQLGAAAIKQILLSSFLCLFLRNTVKLMATSEPMTSMDRCIINLTGKQLGKVLSVPAYTKQFRVEFEKFYLEKYGVPYEWKSLYDFIMEEIENENFELW